MLARLIYFLLLSIGLSACAKKTSISLDSRLLGKGLPLYDVQFYDDNFGIAVGGDYWTTAQLFITTDGGTTWQDKTPVIANNQALTTIHFVSANNIYIGGALGTVLHSTDTFRTFKQYGNYDYWAIKDIEADSNFIWVCNSSPASALILKYNKNYSLIDSLRVKMQVSDMQLADSTMYLAAHTAMLKCNNNLQANTLTIDGLQGDLFMQIAASNNQQICCGFNGSIHRRTIGGEWQKLKAQNNFTSNRNLQVLNKANNLWLLAGDDGLVQSVDLSGAVKTYNIGTSDDITGMCTKPNGTNILCTKAGKVLTGKFE
jgi:Photosynthesis system II assembly factor YCF48